MALFLLAAVNLILKTSVKKEPVQTEETEQTTQTQQTEQTKSPSTAVEDSLLIGDSRMVGLADYADLHGAHFFANVGMTVYNAQEVRASIPSVGKVTLEELLNGRKYDKIYLMLGINELGYEFQQTVDQYKSLVNFIRETQPQARLFLMANLHVTQARSNTDKNINNPAIDRFNQAVSDMADGKTIFYLDANGLFDDETGSLAEGKSADNVHLQAEGYRQWGRWLEEKTSEVLNGT